MKCWQNCEADVLSQSSKKKKRGDLEFSELGVEEMVRQQGVSEDYRECEKNLRGGQKGLLVGRS